jgi:hypothetical protein
MVYTKFIRRRLTNLGVKPKDALPVSEMFQRQIDNMGAERASQYFKNVGDCLLNYYYGSPSRPAWVAVMRSGFPKVLASLRGYSEEILIRVAKLARVIILSRVSPKQVKKVVSAPEEAFSGSLESVELMTRFVSLAVNHYCFPSLPMSFIPEHDRIANHFRRTLTTSASASQYDDGSKGGPAFLESFQILKSLPELQVPGWYTAFWPMTEQSCNEILLSVSAKEFPSVGEIHASQEGGAKLRMFASPYTIVQSLLSPIHNYVDKFRRLLKSDCTYDQMSGAVWTQEKLRKGVVVSAFDLSTATCRYPLEPQLELLLSLGIPRYYVEALRRVCRGHWIVGKELRGPFNRDYLKWVVGQPLGIRPSMSMFSLHHNLLLAGIALSHGSDPEDSFRVLGDDVVISCPKVAKSYAALIQSCGVPISWNKCHTSNKVSEFAGATISLSTILRPGQWREATPENVIALADSLGVPTYNEVSRAEEVLQEAYLFMDGRFNPPPEHWPIYLRISSTMSTLLIDNFKLSTAPYRYYQSMKHIDKQLSGLLFKPISYVWDDPQVLRTAFKSILPLLPAESVDFALSIKGQAHWHSDNGMLTCVSVLTVLESLFIAGSITFDTYTECCERCIRDVHSVLWLEPPKGGKERMFRKLAKQLRLVKSLADLR